ncbi:MAG: hypothetical protein PHT16_00605 [Candidatus Pacebacteria bacterium]|nr:hypothetical protein [Candidatus Paceibacterota bacterium]
MEPKEPKIHRKPTKRINLMPIEKSISEIEEERKDLVIPEEEAGIEKEIENLPPEDKEKMGRWYNNLGFKAEKAKNDIFASVFNKALKLKNIDPKGTTGKFCKEALDGFVRNAKIAEKKANDPSAFSDIKKGVYIKGKKRGITISAGKQKFASNVGAFSGNALKYLRLIADATGLTVGAAHRVVMAAGMATTWLAETSKETRFKNEKLIAKTRIGKDITRESSAEEVMQFLKDNEKDIEKAEEEAWNIYEKAGGTFENDSKGNRIWKANDLSAEDLKNKYLIEIPKDLQKRLQNPSLASNFILRFAQRALRRELLGYKIEDHILFEGSISRLNKKIEELENSKRLTPEQKKYEIEKLITKQKKNLEDYDRMITQYGIIDGTAMLLKYAQTAGKATVAVLQVETLALSVNKMFEGISHLLTSHNIHPIEGTGKSIKDILQKEKTAEEPRMPEETTAPEHPVKPEIKPEVKPAETPDHKIEDSVEKENIVKPPESETTETSKPPEPEAGNKSTEATSESKVGAEQAQAVEKEETETETKTETESKTAPAPETPPAEPAQKTELESLVFKKPITPEELTKTIQDQLTAKEPPGTVHMGTQYNTGTPYEVGTSYNTGEIRGTGGGGYAENYYGNQPIVFGGNRYYPDSEGQYHDFLGRPYFPNLSPEDNSILQQHPEFAENPYNLPETKLVQIYENSQKDLSYIFRDEPSGWDKYLSNSLKEGANKVLEYQQNPSDDPAGNYLSGYLNMLKNHANLKPKGGFLGMGAEKSDHFIARCLQKLASTGELEVFEANLRK